MDVAEVNRSEVHRAGSLTNRWQLSPLNLLNGRAAWVLIDQGIVSIGNFFMLGVLQRTLIPSEMGIYQVLFETILYLNGLQNALVIYPLLVRGASGSAKNLQKLATASLFFTLMLFPLLGGATVASIGLVKSWNILLSASLALLCWQLQETTRRALISEFRMKDAVWGDAVSYLGQSALVVLFAHYDLLTLNHTYIVMAVTSLAGTIIQALQIGLRPVRWSEVKGIAADFFDLGRWTLLANASGIVTNVGYSWTLLAFHGKEANAIFAAVVFAFKLANPVINSLGGLVTPEVSRASSVRGEDRMRSARRYVLLGCVLLAPYFLFLLVFADSILQYLSSGGKSYWQYPHLLRLFVVNYSAVFLIAMITSWLGGLGRSRYNFYVSLVNILATAVLGLPLTAIYGVTGLIAGSLVASICTTVAAILLLRRASRESLKAPMCVVPSSR